MRFRLVAKELWPHCRADEFEENNGGVTGARVLTDAGDLGALPLSYPG